jgi:hypothetical protein
VANWVLTSMSRLFDGEKRIVSSTNGAGKTRQPLVKE